MKRFFGSLDPFETIVVLGVCAIGGVIIWFDPEFKGLLYYIFTGSWG